MALIGATNAEKIWNFLKSKGLSDYSCAGIIGNLDAESGLNPTNLQDSYNGAFKFTDEEYTALVDSGVYSRTQFAYDRAGYGIMQLSWHSRKSALYDYAKSKGVSIGDLEMQLEFFYKEISEDFPGVLCGLKTTNSIQEASNIILLKYECPADQSAFMQNRRASVSQTYYSRFASGQAKEAENIMGYKYFTKGQAVKVSAHFYSTEFDCHGSGCCSQTIVNEKLIELVEQIRNHFNAPITITSPYRCQIHNSRVGGAVGSRHSKGDAVDIVVKGVAPRKVAQYAESIGVRGIGLYETAKDGYFVHIDTRSAKSFWYGQNEQPVNTFGAYTGTTTSTTNTGNAVNTSILNTILNRGDYGTEVKALQQKLIKLGFTCGADGADGDFGPATEEAVRRFQESVSGLGIDGIAGYNTLKAIDAAIANASKDAGRSRVKVTATELNVRYGPGKQYTVKTRIRKDEVYELIDESNGWVKLKDPAGWVSMEYVEKL